MKDNKEIIVTVSGGFDPLHIGHVELLKRAREFGDKLVVIMNNDNWLLGEFLKKTKIAALLGIPLDIADSYSKTGDCEVLLPCNMVGVAQR